MTKKERYFVICHKLKSTVKNALDNDIAVTTTYFKIGT